MRFLLIGLGGVFIAIAVILIAARIPAVQNKLMDRAIAKAVNADASALFDDDGIKVVFCGTGSPLASLKRAQACTAIIAGDDLFLVDAGTGSWEVLQNTGVPADRLKALFLTHFHSDHIGDLSEANLNNWVSGRNAPLDVYGPEGVEDVVAGINAAFALDNRYRTAHHGKAIASPRTAGLAAKSFDAPGAVTVFNENGLKVTAFPVDHKPVDAAVGYRFDYQGRSVVVSGDTAYSESLVDAANGADLLIHEAQANHIVERIERAAAKAGRASAAKIMDDIQSYHSSPTEAARAANEARADWLVLTHLTPPPDNAITRRIFMRGVSDVRRKNVKIAEDGMIVLLPRGGGVRFTRHQ